MRHLPSSRALLAGISGLLFAFAPGTAVAGSGATQVSGLFTPDSVESPACTDHPAALQRGVMTGSLEGCWYVDTVTSEKVTPSGGYKATGTETFIGCLDDACGQLFTTFTFTAKFNADGTEDHGRCHHPIVGGTGDFAGVTGVINMHDLPNGCATYKGHLTF
jgi:hypothetical protein